MLERDVVDEAAVVDGERRVHPGEAAGDHPLALGFIDNAVPLLPHAFILWFVRVLLLGAVAVHITGIVQLRARSRAARGGHPARRIGRSFSAATTIRSQVSPRRLITVTREAHFDSRMPT